MLARRFQGIVHSQLPIVGRVPTDTTVSGYLTIKWWPITWIYNRGYGKEKATFSQLASPRFGFALAAQGEAGVPYPSAYTLGYALTGIDRNHIITLFPGQLKGAEGEYDTQRPPERAFPRWTRWIDASCIGMLIARTYAPRSFFNRDHLKSLTPATFTQDDEDKIKSWVAREERSRLIGGNSADTCRLARAHWKIGSAQAAAVIGLPWQSNLQDLVSTYKVRIDQAQSWTRSEEVGLEWMQYIQVLNAAMLRLMVQRSRDKGRADGTSRYMIPPEWREPVEQAEARGLFQSGAGRPRGPMRRVVARRQLPGMPEVVRSNIPGEESLIVREVPWYPGKDDEDESDE